MITASQDVIRETQLREPPRCYNCNCIVKSKTGNFSEFICDDCKKLFEIERKREKQLNCRSAKFKKGLGYEVIECPSIPGTNTPEFPIGSKFTKEELNQMVIGGCLVPGMKLYGYNSYYSVNTEGRIKIIREEN